MRSPSYPDETISRALAYPGADEQAAAAVNVPRRTVTRWRAQYRADPGHFGPTVQAAVSTSIEDTLTRVRAVRDAALAEMLRRVTDPRTKAGELASIFREVRDETALLEGRATVRTESMVGVIDANLAAMPPMDVDLLTAWLEHVTGDPAVNAYLAEHLSDDPAVILDGLAQLESGRG